MKLYELAEALEKNFARTRPDLYSKISDDNISPQDFERWERTHSQGRCEYGCFFCAVDNENVEFLRNLHLV